MQSLIPPLLSMVRLGGPIAELMERFFYHRIHSEEARSIVYREAADAFKNKLDDESGLIGLWQGEYWGKWMIGAAHVCEYSGNAETREFIRRVTDDFLLLQEPSGYLGTYRNPLFLKATEHEKIKELIGWDCDWNWNIWCRKYTLWGILSVWRLLGDSKYLSSAVRFADQLICMLHDNHIRLHDTGTFKGVASCSIVKPMLILYQATNDQKYLDFCISVVADFERMDGAAPNLIVNAGSHRPVHEWYPHEDQWAKAYEMMSCLEGLLLLYRITGEKKYFQTVADIFSLLKQHEMTALFGVGYNDQFRHASAYINAIHEPCDSIHWMRLCHELFSLTGDSAYIDAFEMTFYNAFLAGVYRDGKWGARGVRSSGRHLTALEQAKCIHNHCCVNNIPRAFMTTAETFIMTDGRKAYINLYSEFSGALLFNDVSLQVDISGSYLADGKVVVILDAKTSDSFEVCFRIPAWSIAAVISVGDTFSQSATGGFHTIRINNGKTKVNLDFNPAPVIRDFQGEVETPLTSNSWHTSRWAGSTVGEGAASCVLVRKMVASPRATITFGPLLLARSKYIGSTEEEMFSSPSIYGKNYTCVLTPTESDHVRNAFRAEIKSGTSTFKTILCDYASAGNEILDDDSFFSIHF